MQVCEKIRICFVGPLLGKNPGWVTSQGEILADLFAKDGYRVRLTSTIPNRVLRIADIARSLVTWQKEIDLVILMVFSGPAFGIADVASRITKSIGKPLALWFHGGNLPEFSKQHPIWMMRILKRGDFFISPSNFLAHHFKSMGINVEVIPNVLDIDNYPFLQRLNVSPRLIWMRTFHDLYHPEMAVEVADILHQKYPQTCLSMAGQDKGKLTTVVDLVRSKDLQRQVKFLGFLDQSAKKREFAHHDIYINTNRVDNMPVSLVEAAAFGLPIVTTAVGGIPYLLKNEETGLLVDDGNVVEMARAVERLVLDPDLSSRLSKNGRQLAEESSWKTVKIQWERIFAKIELHG